MVKYIQRIRRLMPKNCLDVFDHFVRLALKGLTHFRLMVLFYIPWTQKTSDFSDVFTLYRKKHYPEMVWLEKWAFWICFYVKDLQEQNNK